MSLPEKRLYIVSFLKKCSNEVKMDLNQGVEMREVEEGRQENVLQDRESVASISGASEWYMCGKVFPRSEVKFFTQVLILYVVIFTCLANLSIGHDELKSVWITLLSSCLGCILSSPTISKGRRDKV